MKLTFKGQERKFNLKSLIAIERTQKCDAFKNAGDMEQIGMLICAMFMPSDITPDDFLEDVSIEDMKQFANSLEAVMREVDEEAK